MKEACAAIIDPDTSVIAAKRHGVCMAGLREVNIKANVAKRNRNDQTCSFHHLSKLWVRLLLLLSITTTLTIVNFEL